MMIRNLLNVFFCLFFVLSVFSCTTDLSNAGDKDESEDVLGFSMLARVPGLWHGPVSSTTPAGSFPMWYVDFRPVSAGQVSQYSRLDKDTINYISFFIVRHAGQLKLAMRTEGVFQNKGCVTYEVIDTVREEAGYYRFVDFQAGAERAYTEYTFSDNNGTILIR